MLLDADVQAGLVVDRTGALRGMITVDSITAVMHEPGARPRDAGRSASPPTRTTAAGRRRPDGGDPLGLDRDNVDVILLAIWQHIVLSVVPLAVGVRHQPRARDLGSRKPGSTARSPR